MEHGIIKDDSKNRQCCIIRTITDLDDHLSCRAMSRFTDLTPDSTVDDEAQAMLNTLREVKIPNNIQIPYVLFI